MYIAFVLKDVGRRGVSASKFPGWEVDISPIPAKDAEILANYEARNSWDIRNIGFLWMKGKWSKSFMWGEAGFLKSWRLAWFGGFFQGEHLRGDEQTSPPISGIINQWNLVSFGVLQPGRGGQGSGWWAAVQVDWLGWWCLGRNHDFHFRIELVPGKTIKKPSDSVGEEFIDKTIYGRLLPRPMFGHLWSGGISELTLFPLGACRVGKDLCDFDELVNCWWLWQYHCRYLNLTYKRVASMKEPVRSVDFF